MPGREKRLGGAQSLEIAAKEPLNISRRPKGVSCTPQNRARMTALDVPQSVLFESLLINAEPRKPPIPSVVRETGRRESTCPGWSFAGIDRDAGEHGLPECETGFATAEPG